MLQIDPGAPAVHFNKTWTTWNELRELGDAVNASGQLRDARTEIARLRDELQTVRADSEDAKVRLARIEGEMDQILKELGYPDGSVKDRYEKLSASLPMPPTKLKSAPRFRARA